jgi:hypothetical protein
MALLEACFDRRRGIALAAKAMEADRSTADPSHVAAGAI